MVSATLAVSTRPRNIRPITERALLQFDRYRSVHLACRGAGESFEETHDHARKSVYSAVVTDKDPLIANLDRVVQDTLAYFDGPGRTSTARVDRWQSRDVLMHFIYFHDATAWGIQSATLDGPPWPVPASSDVVNEVCRRLHEHESLDEL